MKLLDGRKSAEGFHVEHRNDKHPPIWGQLNTKKVGDNAASDIQLVSDPVHLQYSNRQTLGDIALVNAATMRNGSPIPETGNIVSTDVITDAQTVVAFRPQTGEVWRVLGMSQTPVGSGSHRTIGALYDGTGSVELWDNTASGTGEQLEYSEPLFIDYNMYLRYTVVTVDTSIQLKIAMIRIR